MVCNIGGMTVFQRARSAEQREVRRRAILDTAAAMLSEMPVSEVTLNELSRRVGLAKSNVLRYFESREAVLLELLATQWQEWLTALAGDLEGAVTPQAPVTTRGDQGAGGPAASPPAPSSAPWSAPRPPCSNATSPRRSPPPTSARPWPVSGTWPGSSAGTSV